MFSNLKKHMNSSSGTISKLKNNLSKMPPITQKITNNIKQMGTGFKSGLKHILKYAMALFSLRGIYSVLSNSASSWLSSQNVGAKQLTANIEYMKYAMGSSFAPVIKYVIGLVYNLMKAIQAVVYALFKVNIFANAGAKSYANMAGSANKAKKETQGLAGIHDELNNVQSSDSKGDSGGTETPNIDLSGIDSQMSPFSEKLLNFFKPLVDSWNTYGQSTITTFRETISSVGNLLNSIWSSFENIIVNGTMYTTLEFILAIIGNIANAFKNAWNNNGNGDVIVQNLANAFNNLLGAINNVIQSPGFQEFLKNVVEKFREISNKIGSIDWQPIISALTTIGEIVGIVALDILSALVDIFKWLVENPIVAEIILAIAAALTIVSGVITVLTAVSAALNIAILPLITIIAVIIGAIALIVLAIMNWDTIMSFLKTTVETVVNAVVQFFTDLWNQVSFIFKAIWNVISTILGFIWNMISTVFTAIWNIISPIINAIWSIISTIFEAIWNTISTILGSIWNIFSQIFNWVWQLTSKVFEGIWNVISPIINKVWETIKFVLEKIQEVWSSIWQSISNVITNIWNGIWGCIKGVINSILGGIEGMVNGVIKGVNFILKGISKVANAVGSLVGINPINLQLSTVSLPRLETGNVAYEPLVAQFGEYSGASTNPEITAPQNIIEETFVRVLSRYKQDNNQVQKLTVNFGAETIFDDMIDYINEKRRRIGKAIIEVG